VGRIVSHGTFYGTCNAHYNGSRAEPFGYAEVWYEAQIPRHEHYAH
jgi:hypothetical protein